MKAYKDLFNKWVQDNNVEIFDRLSDVTGVYQTDLQTGQVCSFINYCFVVFPGYTIMGFCKPTSWGGCVYLDKDSYWYPVNPKNIFLDSEIGKMEISQDKNHRILTISKIKCIVQAHKKDEFVNLSPIQTGRETFDEGLENIRIDFVKNQISTDGKKTIKWLNFTQHLKPKLTLINKILHTD